MFQFQQFSIIQEKAAMKVGTDGVLLGIWTPVNSDTHRILDVGTGTGLVALMLAQRCSSARIDAIEIDLPSCEDARRNFDASPWGDRLILSNASFQLFSDSSPDRYDLIVCNPPFFSGGLANSCERKATARHNFSLNNDELLDGTLSLLNEDGRFSVILPFSDYEKFRVKAARKGLFEYHRLLVKPTPEKPVKRVISLWSMKMHEDLISEELTVELSRHHYSDNFRRMAGEFFLK